MLSQNKKTIMITITSLVITGATLGGVVNAQQSGVNAQQSAINTQQVTFDEQQYRFPPADAIQDIQLQKPAPVAKQVTRPVANAQPPGPAQWYQWPEPAQRPKQPNARPNHAASGPYASGPFASGPRRSGPGARPPYGAPGPYNQNPYNRGPNQGPYGQNPYSQGPYGNPYNRGPYGRGPSNDGPFGGGSPFKKFGGGPFNSNSAPWETWPFGAPDSFWSRKDFPFNEQNPTDWFQPDDPKEGMAVMWDDLIAAPDELGTMPGGWRVPSVSVPNPIDLEDQLEKASKEIPDLIRVYND